MRAIVLIGALAALVAATAGGRAAPPSSPTPSLVVVTTDGRLLLVTPTGRRLARLTTRWQNWDPAWSPDGRQLAFVRTTDGRRSFRIYVMRADGGGVRRLTSGRFDESPSWSPDGRWIAYAAEDGIRLVRPDGTGRRLVPGTGERGARYTMSFASNPSWTPGGRLAYSFHPEDSSDWPASCRTPSSRCGWVLTSTLDGRSRRAVVRGRDAHWSPDGRLVVYTPPDGGVAVIPATGDNGRFLGKGYLADWSADGKAIVFARLGDAASGDSVWTMSANGSNRRRIVRGATAPAWRPVPLERDHARAG